MRNRTDMLPLVVGEIVKETASIVSVRLQHPDASPLPAWEPGAHIDLQLITRHERQYSLCGDPADVSGYRIAVRREEFSRGGSQYIHDHLRVGSRVWVRPPRNLFTLGEARSYLLLAAGIGVTPILAMARHLDASGADWRMVYLARTRSDVAFAAELEALGERARVHISSEDGRLDLDALVTGLESGTDVYACGPQGFVDALDAITPPEGCRVHMERFAPKPRVFGPNEPFTVTAATSEVTVEVAAERSMLHALQSAGVDVGGSCLRGVCGSCALQVLDGTPEHRDSLNTDDASTTIYPCVSRATGTLVVDA